MMKKLIITLVLMVFLADCFSQEYVPTQEDVERFFRTKTLVVLEDNPLLEYNFIIREVVEQIWDLTEYEFIPYKEFEEKRKNPAYSFLVMTKVAFERDRTGANFNFLNLLLGGNYYRLDQMPAIVSVPLSFASVEEESYIYKLGTLVRFVQNHVRLIKEDPSIISANVFKHYNENMEDIKTKTLYLVADELEPSIRTQRAIRNAYPYKFQLVTREDIKKAIDDSDESVVFLHKVGPEGTKLEARCYKVIIGAADAKFYYFDFHRINNRRPDGLLEQDLKKLGRN